MKKVIMFALALSAGAVFACDNCVTYVALGSWESTQRASVSLFEQYAKYDATPDGEEEFKSSTTQLGAGYRFSDRWALQFSAPYVDHELGSETESGLGDVSLLGIYRVVNVVTEKNVTLVDVYAGIKAPTGNTDPLEDERDVAREEAEEHEHAGGVFLLGHGAEHHDGEGAEAEGHAEPEEHHESDGHHLALGSGSWDGIFGARGLAQRGRWRGNIEAQYVARTEGDFDYQYGDEFIARIGARYLVALSHDHSIAVGADLMREWSDDNEVLGETQDESGKSTAYVGPAIDVTWGDALTASAAYDFAIEGEDEGVHGAADQRVRASLGYLF